MIRILIVDDEILVRIGLKTIIPMENPEFQIIGEASNGREAMNILETSPCDLVLTDIRMQDMDGLELMEHIRERWPGMKCIILSNHNDFPYVQKAIRLGAVDYLIKVEMEPAELMRKLYAIQDLREAERQKSQEAIQLENRLTRFSREIKERRLREILLARTTRSEAESTFSEFQISGFKLPVHVIVIQIERYRNLLEENRFKSQKLMHYTVSNVLEEIMRKYAKGELVEIDNGKFCILLERFTPTMLEEMRNAAATFLKLSISFGASRPVIDIHSIPKAYAEAEEALQYRFYTGYGHVIQHERLPEKNGNAPGSWNIKKWEPFVEHLDLQGMRKEFGTWADSAAAEMALVPQAAREHVVRLLDLLALNLQEEEGSLYAVPPHEGQFPYQAIREMETLSDIRQWFEGWLPLYLQYRKEQLNRKLRPEIQAVIRIIHEQYSLPLKVGELAAQVGFTENYLSILFRKETGQTITDFLVQYRMKKARELLKDPQNKIYEISERVGYPDPNHFSRSFKQTEGMYPTEYRKMVLNKK